MAIYILRTKFKRFELGSIGCVIFLYLFCAARLVLPVEFPWTRGIPFAALMNPIYSAMNLRCPFMQGTNLYVYQLFLLTWLIGAVVLAVRFFAEYRHTVRQLQKIPTIEKRVDQELLEQFYHGPVLHVRECTFVDNPFSYGVRKKEILLPNVEMTNEERSLILRHEAMHHRNRDLLLNFLVQIFCCLFWWNPMVYLMKKDLNQTIELRCDRAVLKEIGDDSKVAYLEVLLKTYKEDFRKEKSYLACLNSSSGRAMEERFTKIAQYKEHRVRFRQFLPACLFALVLLLSYSFSFQTHFESPKLQNTKEDIYFEQNDSYIEKIREQYYLVSSGQRTELNKKEVKMLVEDGFELRGDE
ncbi:MAG: M56 family metallopeptidase [Lachnospiraceae bacterium]|nr:M56 family metallopeptidase [Lachnospiraceae bacterium]MCI2194652.1 M56 family metallopeptidase [Lachnospiraceae bacterium]